MPTSILDVRDLLEAVEAQLDDRLPDGVRFTRPAHTPPAGGGRRAGSALQCPSCGSSHVAQMLGDNGGISFVCTACGHSWS
ncbi:hypothetical protein [Streptomyces sp. NPDC020742]|uniref:hypothetical protein n=1 Tax=unclassified Streptomyces TaxID=2593676 RepID=UPI0033D48C49